MYCSLLPQMAALFRPAHQAPSLKIKFYCSVNGKLASKEAYAETDKQLDAKINTIMKDLGV
jgi:phosphoglucomutase